jgi:5'-phosphate synthase pdxT subunit
MKAVGVLALQGAFREHILMFRRCGAAAVEVRLPGELEEVSGLVIPGGESTTMTKLMVEYGFPDRIRAFSNAGNPIFGTCAGAIVLSGRLGGKKQDFLNLIDMDVERNAYGRQVDSRETEIAIAALGAPGFPAIFIRAPIIRAVGRAVEPLAAYDDTVVFARQGKVLVSTFHPELTNDPRIHRYFLGMINGAA